MIGISQDSPQESLRLNLLDVGKLSHDVLRSKVLVDDSSIQTKLVAILQQGKKTIVATHGREREPRSAGGFHRTLFHDLVDDVLVVEEDDGLTQRGDGADGAVLVLEGEPVLVFRRSWRRDIFDVAEDGQGRWAWGEGELGFGLFAEEEGVEEDADEDDDALGEGQV